MTEEKAYQLRAGVEDFAGGSVAVGPDGATFNLGEALAGTEHGPKDYIVTSDTLVQASLESEGLQELFKNTSVPQKSAAPRVVADKKE